MIVYYSEMNNTYFEKLQPLSGCMFDNLKVTTSASNYSFCPAFKDVIKIGRAHV